MSPALPRTAVDADAALSEFVDLWSAETADDLHRALVLSTPYRRSADAYEPFSLLGKHHETEPETSLVTALLLLTDRRWRSGAGRLVRRIADASILKASELDLLAETFVAAGDAVYWEAPESWFHGTAEIELGVGPRVKGGGTPVTAGPVVARREVPPPLRRWSAARLVSHEPARWSALLARAGELDRRGGAAVMSGLLDAVEHFAAPAQDLVIAAAVASSDRVVRRAALELVATRQGAQAAYEAAKGDPNAGIRSWADSLTDSDERPPAATARQQLLPL